MKAVEEPALHAKPGKSSRCSEDPLSAKSWRAHSKPADWRIHQACLPAFSSSNNSWYNSLTAGCAADVLQQAEVWSRVCRRSVGSWGGSTVHVQQWLPPSPSSPSQRPTPRPPTHLYMRLGTHGHPASTAHPLL